ncbi:AsmA-like C-terminal region-containing protein [Paludibacter sp.]
MKKVLKITLISLSALIAVIVIAVGILIWVVFTPEKLTPIVRNQLDEMLICEHQLGDVELTFFSTFPKFGVKINGFLLKNSLPGAPSDTVVNADAMVASIDFMSLWKQNELIVDELFVDNAFILAYTDSTGHSNYDIMKPDEEPDTTEFKLPFNQLALDKIKLKNSKLVYHDAPRDMVLSLSGLDADVNMNWKEDLISGKLVCDAKAFSFYWDETDYLIDNTLEVNSPYSFDMSQFKLLLEKGKLSLNKMDFDVDALIHNRSETDDILLDIAFNSVELPTKPVIDLMSVPFGEYLEGMTIDGLTYINGSLKGVIGDSIMPVFALNADFNKTKFEYESLPYKLFDMSGKADVVMDLNDNDKWYVKVSDFKAKTGKSSLSGSAYVDQLRDDMRFDINANTSFNLVDAKPMLPDDMNMDIKGLAIGNAKIKFLYSQFKNDQYDKMFVSGKFTVKDLAVDYDTISLRSHSADLALKMPNIKSKQTSFIDLDIASKLMDIKMGKSTNAMLQNLAVQVATSNMLADNKPLVVKGKFNGKGAEASMDNLQALLDNPNGDFFLQMDMQDSTAVPLFDCNFDLQGLKAAMDTIQLAVVKPNGRFVYKADQEDEKRPFIQLKYNSNQLSAKMGATTINTKDISVDAGVAYDDKQTNLLLQWIPKGFVKMKEGVISTPQFASDIQIPAIDFDFTPDEYLIRDSRLVIDKSDFQLTGMLSNVRPYLRDEGLLKGDFNFRSHTTDVNHLMDMFSGFGGEDPETATEKKAEEESGISGPFMVPKGVDISLYTSISEALVSKDTARNVQGTVTVKDGVMVLQSMLFTTSAAKMQLTGMYKSPRRNHLFTGIDLHLLEIEIPELLKLIPDVDTIMPMLRSFAGSGEFHMTIETYLDSAYNLKKSTILGAASVRGKDLVLLDGETFTEIAKTLRFNKKTENKIDSLSAEFTVIKNNVYVYPFLIVMDKYKAVVDGRHNLDMNFDYHISLVDSPLPVQLGVDVKGNLDDMKIKPVKCKYANMYRPARRTEVDTKKLELRNMIYKALSSGVREE